MNAYQCREHGWCITGGIVTDDAADVCPYCYSDRIEELETVCDNWAKDYCELRDERDNLKAEVERLKNPNGLQAPVALVESLATERDKLRAVLEARPTSVLWGEVSRTEYAAWDKQAAEVLNDSG